MKENAVSAVEFPGSKRIHIGLAVTDLQHSRRFYRTLLGVEPSKQRPGYVKFEPIEPSLNLSLSQTGPERAKSHLPIHYGIQVKSSGEVEKAAQRLRQAGLAVKVEEQTACCYALQDKVWVEDPDGNQWEVFVVLGDSPQRRSAESECCRDEERASAQVAAPCCADQSTACCAEA